MQKNMVRKGLVLVIIMLFIGAGVVPGMSVKDRDRDYTVTSTSDSGPGTLRECMMNAVSGDTIYFDPTVFPPGNPANIALTSSLPQITQGNLTIDASNAGVILNGSSTPVGTHGFHIISDSNTIKGMQILSFPTYGILIENGANINNITGNYIFNNSFGIRLDYSNNSNISGNTISSNSDGIYSYYSRNNKISGNTIIYNNDGIHFSRCSYNNISNNTISSNYNKAIWISWHSSNNNILDNTITNSTYSIHISLYCNYNNISSNTIILNGGISISDSYGNIILNNSLTSSGTSTGGISLSESNGNIISYNYISNNRRGIRLTRCDNNNISLNTINSSNSDGIYLTSCDNNKISINTIISNNKDGLRLNFNCNDNFIFDNIISSNNGYGIYLSHSSGNNISGNTIISNIYDGIYLYYYGFYGDNVIYDNIISSNSNNGIYINDCENNLISRNNISSNEKNGIYFYHSGIYMGNNDVCFNTIRSNNKSGIYFYESKNHRLFCNNFINNIRHVNSSGYSCCNRWRSSSKITYTYNSNTYTNYLGNYWDNYTGIDSDGDGIGDTPYIINGDNDGYPLMEEFENYFGENQPPTCAIELQKDGIPIYEIDVEEFFDIYVGDSSGGITHVRFLSDENQNGIVDDGFTWTEWYDWNISSGDWHADTKIKEWLFATGGSKEVWVEVKDTAGQTSRCSANIYADIGFVIVDISTDKGSYSPFEDIIVTVIITDADGNLFDPFSFSYEFFVDGIEVDIEDFEFVSYGVHEFTIKAPETSGDHIIEVVLYTPIGTGFDYQSITVSPVDSDGDGLFDYEEDKDGDEILDPDETNPNNPDTDGDGMNDKDDLYPWLTTNRKALVIGITEYDSEEPSRPDIILWSSEKVTNLKKLGFEVDKQIDEIPDDGDVITYDEVSTMITNFRGSLSSNDVAIVYLNTHGGNLLGKYYILYGDGLYPGYPWLPWHGKTLRDQLDDIGTYLDFLWLDTCYSSLFRNQVSNLGAGGIIFFGNEGEARTWSPPGTGEIFYCGIAGDCYEITVDQSEISAFEENPDIESVEIIEEYENGNVKLKVCSKQQRYVEDTVNDVNFIIERLGLEPYLEIEDQYPSSHDSSGKMDFMNPLLTHKSPDVYIPRTKGTTQTPDETFASVNYTLWDSDGDDINDAVTVTWDANTIFPQDNVSVLADVRNSSFNKVKSFIYGPYTIYGNSSENSSFNFYSTKTDTYSIVLWLYNSSFNPVDIAFIANISLNAGTGGPGGEEEFTNTWFNTSDHNGDGVDDTINVSWNINTTLPEENVSVLVRVRDNILKYGPYTIHSSLSNEGEIEFYAGEIGVYDFSLYLVDSNSDFEDSSFLKIPLEISRFTDSYVDQGLDTDSDGKYNYLTIDIEVNVTTVGNYILQGSLYDAEGNLILITTNSTYLAEGLQIVPLDFDGETIYEKGVDGPYQLRYLMLYEDGFLIGYRNRPYTTSLYNYTEFQSPAVMFDSFTDYGVDTNSNGLYEYLRIDTNINTTIAGNYTLIGYLSDENGDFIASATNSSYLNIGLQTVQLDFNGSIISYRGINGSYILTVNAYRNDTPVNMGKDVYATNTYVFTQFETSPVILEWNFNNPLDVLLDRLFNVTVVITNPSNRILHGLEASLTLPFEFNTTYPLNINIGELEPEETKEIEWTLKGINPGYEEIEVNVTSMDIQNISIVRGIAVIHFPLFMETDKETYNPGDDVIINATVTNNNPEVTYFNLTINLTISSIDMNNSYFMPIDYISILETKNFTTIWNSTGYPSGNYNVIAKIMKDSTSLNETLLVFEIIDINITTPPVIYGEYPINESTDVERPPTELGATAEDPDGDLMDVYIKWIRHDYYHVGEEVTLQTYIGVGNGTYNFIPPTDVNDWIWGDTTYTWSVNVTDGTTWTNETYQYTTGGSRYDVNNDDNVNFQDAGLVWVHRTSEVCYDGIYDVNGDCQVNFQDAGLTWINRD